MKHAVLALWVVALAALGACGDEENENPFAQPCGGMTRGQCLNAPGCTLSLTDEPQVYACEVAEGPCEDSVLQTDAQACQAIEGCIPSAGECYCGCRGYGRTSFEDGNEAEACLCACGGGEPPGCHASGAG